jgi:hypothetical protein
MDLTDYEKNDLTYIVDNIGVCATRSSPLIILIWKERWVGTIQNMLKWLLMTFRLQWFLCPLIHGLWVESVGIECTSPRVLLERENGVHRENHQHAASQKLCRIKLHRAHFDTCGNQTHNLNSVAIVTEIYLPHDGVSIIGINEQINLSAFISNIL